MSLIFKKMTLVMAEIKAVGKDQKNSQQGFNFRGIDDMLNSLNPCLTKHGIFLAPKVISFTQDMREVTRSSGKTGIDKHVHLLVEYTFYAEDGSSVVIGPISSEGLDSGDKATNKALSSALKYALIQTFAVPTEDMDDSDKTSPEIVKEDKKSPAIQTSSSEEQKVNVPSKSPFRPKPVQTKQEGDLI
jgi:hypothetical protein